jgi:hypothetical protein
MISVQQNFPYDLITWNLLSHRKKYESWKSCNIWGSFHICKSFTKIFERKNKSEYNSSFWLNLPALRSGRTYPTPSDSKDIVQSLSCMMLRLLRWCPMGWDMSHETIGIQNKQLKNMIFYIYIQYERNNLMYLES